MNDRLLTLGGALFVLLLLLGLLMPRQPEATHQLSRPLSSDGGDAGLLGLHRWLEQSSVPVARLRDRYTALDQLGLPLRGNLLVTVDPPLYGVRHSERAALQEWISAGNTVLVLSGQPADVSWARRRKAGEILSALELQVDVPGENGDPACRKLPPLAPTAGLRELLPPPQPHPAVAGVRRAYSRALPDKSVPAPLTRQYAGALPLALLCDGRTRAAALSQLSFGDGRVWFSPFVDVFSNARLDQADNARLFASLASWALRGNGAVIFDDMHQGDSQLYDPAAFFRDPRLRHSLYFVIVLWLLYLLGRGNRFGALPPPRRGVSSLSFVRALGGFYARTLAPAAVAQGLLRHFFNAVRSHARLPANGEPAWEVLTQAAAVDRHALAELRQLQQRVQAGRRVDLRRLHALTLQLRNQLS